MKRSDRPLIQEGRGTAWTEEGGPRLNNGRNRLKLFEWRSAGSMESAVAAGIIPVSCYKLYCLVNVGVTGRNGGCLSYFPADNAHQTTFAPPTWRRLYAPHAVSLHFPVWSLRNFGISRRQKIKWINSHWIDNCSICLQFF